MKRTLAAIVLALSLVVGLVSPAGANNWVQGWHWPRWFGTGSSAYETRVYFVAGPNLASYQKAYVNWAAYRWGASPALLAVPITASKCPVRSDGIPYNCVLFQTGNNRGGSTSITTGSGAHILKATVTLDDDIGRGTDYIQDRYIACHEGGHSLGGGFDDPNTAVNEHHLCNKSNGYPTAEDYQSLARAYNHHG